MKVQLPAYHSYSSLIILTLVCLSLCVTLAAAQETSRTTSRPREEAILPSSTTTTSSTSGNSTDVTRTTSGNTTVTETGRVNGTQSTNSTNTTSSKPTSEATKPYATEFVPQTAEAPGPAAAGGGNVAQSPDDSYIASAHRQAIIELTSVVGLVGILAWFTLLAN